MTQIGVDFLFFLLQAIIAHQSTGKVLKTDEAGGNSVSHTVLPLSPVAGDHNRGWQRRNQVVESEVGSRVERDVIDVPLRRELAVF